jgi:NTE family protein
MDQNRRNTLVKCLATVFGPGQDSLIEEILPHLDLVELNGGQTLVQKADPADAVYFVVSGRLRALVNSEEQQVNVDEITRGDTFGASGVLMKQEHPETILAIRDSLLARMPDKAFEELWHRFPEFSKRMAHLMVARMKRNSKSTQSQKPATVCIVPISDGFDIASFSNALKDAMTRFGTVTLQMRDTVESRFGRGAADARPTEERYQKLSVWLDDIEQDHDFTLLIADDGESEWTRRCIRHADEVLFVARMDAPMRIHPIEKRLCMGDDAITAARQTIVLFHPDWQRYPTGTGAWFDRRPIDALYHIRPERDSDIARLARILTGNATGLVLSGGGAKGFAHLGVYKALQEAGIEVDFVGGTSIGAVMAAYVSFDLPADEVIEHAKRAFASNPTGDFSLFPMLSLFKGKRLKKTIDKAVIDATGVEADLLDSWRTMFCIASSFSDAREIVIRRGRLDLALRASVSIPIALPPVPHFGELLVDGGIFNNFPTDVMSQMGVRKLIGVDLSIKSNKPYSYDEIPSTWDLVQKSFKGDEHPDHIPSLGTILMGTSLLYSESRRKQSNSLVDLYINPDLSGIGLLDWKAFDKTVELGYKEACEVLSTRNGSLR